jgi:hypothetical protein
MSKYWLNIFDSCEVSEVYPNNYWIIKYNKETNSCELFDHVNNLVPDAKFIIDKYNIFVGDHIIVDRDSFITNGITKISQIVDFVIDYYKISWIKKILIKKDLPSNKLEGFISESKCDIVDLFYRENTCNIILRDNLGDTYYMSVLFHERTWCKSEPYYSKFSISKPNFSYL